MDLHWQDGFEISAATDAGGAIVLSANREGLVSLARILRALAEEAPGSHVHLDASNSLEEGSADLIIERTA
ncbi:MAG: hypothetical protein IK061_07475 [Desulfovibrio sp.]|nr:hypothetical protein [Desulfovibrio sp.]